MQELLVVGVEFLDVGMVRIEVEHPILSLDNLIVWLKEWRLSNQERPLNSV